MYIDALVIEVTHPSSVTGYGRGLFRFAALPTVGDRITIPAPSSDLDIFEVVSVEHNPLGLADDGTVVGTLRTDPQVMIFACAIDRFTGLKEHSPSVQQ